MPLRLALLLWTGLAVAGGGGPPLRLEIRLPPVIAGEEDLPRGERLARIDSLESDSATLERIARERYGMIRDGEILYRFADPEPTATSTEDARREDEDPR